MRVAEPGVGDPAPAERRADPDGDQAAADEQHDAEVDDEDRVSHHPGVMFASRITFSHFVPSDFMKGPNSSGVLPTGT